MERENAGTIIGRYAGMVYRLAVAQMHDRSDADDVFQEVFLRYVRAAPDFQSEEHRKAWLLRVTVNCCRKVQGSAWRRRTQPLSEQLPAPGPEAREALDLLDGLPIKYRAVLHLFYYEGYGAEEIGRILGRKTSTVRSQLTRGRALLRDKLKGEYGYE